MSLREKLEKLSKKESVYIESLDETVEVCRLSLKEMNEVEKLYKKNPDDAVLIVLEIGSRWILQDGKPIFEKTEKKYVGELAAIQVKELVDAFNSVNENASDAETEKN